jgi:hypothetical protein
MGLTPRTLTGIIMRLLMNHFSDPAAIMTPNLRQYLFSPTQTDSKIRIEKAVTFNPAGAGLFPALIVKRMASESRRHSLGDRTDNPNTGTDDDALKGISHFSRFNTGVHRIFCIAEASAVSEDLAQEVFDFFSFLSPAIREHLPFHDFEVIGLGEDGALTETATQVGISVDVKYVYEYAWTLEALAPRIKVFKIQPTH